MDDGSDDLDYFLKNDKSDVSSSELPNIFRTSELISNSSISAIVVLFLQLVFILRISFSRFVVLMKTLYLFHIHIVTYGNVCFNILYVKHTGLLKISF